VHAPRDPPPSEPVALPVESGLSPGSASPAAGDGANLLRGDRSLERERLIEAMERSGWVQAKAARLLGLTPRQIGYALKKHGIPIKRY
jgi:Nif-specific regulatory protein